MAASNPVLDTEMIKEGEDTVLERENAKNVTQKRVFSYQCHLFRPIVVYLLSKKKYCWGEISYTYKEELYQQKRKKEKANPQRNSLIG